MADQRVIKQVDDALFVETEPLGKGGPGSGNFGHAGRIGMRGGSGGGGMVGGGGAPRPSDAQIQTALKMGLAQWIPGVYVDPNDVEWSVKEIPTTQIKATEKKTPSQDMVDAYSNHQQMPPISVANDGTGKYYVLDGNHRLKAARTAGVQSIWAVAIERKIYKAKKVQPVAPPAGDIPR